MAESLFLLKFRLCRTHPLEIMKLNGRFNTITMYSTIIIFLLIAVAHSHDSEMVVLRAVKGRDARLPCGQGKVFLDGPDSYILWLKNDREFLYRFPNEETARRSQDHHNVFGTSCDAQGCHDDTSLLLKRVSEADSGTYRCRVHYQASPSVDYVINMRLVGSPGMPRIYDGSGHHVKKGFIGPLHLGVDITLICEVDDEQPETLVYWRRNGVLIERAHSTGPGVLRADVHVHNVTRSELDAHYECLAQNADVTDPLIASVVIKMYLPPLTVEIRLDNNLDFEASQPRVVDCVVVGCVPPPSITWHLGGTMLRPNVHKELHDGNFTVSSLTLAPSLRDNKQELVCQAHNSHFTDAVFEDKVTLNVGYRPICLTTTEETLGVIQREAETVICVVEALPEPLQFSWTFADFKTLYTGVKKVPGHHHRYSSSLTWLPRDGDVGLLLCRATNSFGEQKRPCAYTVIPGSPPLTPECVALKSYPNTVRVQCRKGWDGGRQQTIHLEVFNAAGTILYNVTDKAGDFNIPAIDEQLNMSAVVYASSTRGRSEKRTILLEMLNPLTAPVTDDAPYNGWDRWLEALVGTVAIITALTTTFICFKAMKLQATEESDIPDLMPQSDGLFHREPDFAREERPTTNITVNQLAACQNQYSSTPVPSCRVLVGCGHASQDSCPTTQHTYFV